MGVGAVLSQHSALDQKLPPRAFFSYRLTSAERNYDIGNQELLAVKIALEELVVGGQSALSRLGQSQELGIHPDHQATESISSMLGP